MTPMAFPLGPQELLIILAIILVLFGGSRLAGLGKSTGRAIREFKDETKGMIGDKDKADETKVDDVQEPVTGELVDRPEQHSTTPNRTTNGQNLNGQPINGQSTPSRHES